MLKRYWSAVLLLFLAGVLYGMDKPGRKKVKILPVPAIGYSPETKTYLGAVLLFNINLYNDSLTRNSNAKLELNYTWNKQMILESEWYYFTRKEKWLTKGKLHYSDYPDLYYGVGYDTPSENKQTYNSKRVLLEASVLQRIGRKLFVGPEVRYINHYQIEVQDSNLVYPELTAASVMGLGFTLLKDSRNSVLTPTQGFYSSVSSTYYFSKANYLKLMLDLRYYKTWHKKITLANRLFTNYCSGTPPFFDYSLVGGDKYVRGFYLGRFRDNNLSALQTECRLPVYRRTMLAAFGGLSNIYSANNPFRLNQTIYNYGMGLRILVDKTENTFLRLDYAIGQGNNSGFYISFGESF